MATTPLHTHISQQFDRELEDIRAKVLAMGGVVEDQLAKALESLANNDIETAELISTNDYKVNAFEVEIDEECMQILARRQPAAGDLRLVLAVTRIISDLERIGDEAEKIARFVLKHQDSDSPTSYLVGITGMGARVRTMVHSALDAFARLDVQAALEVAKQDQEIDELYTAVLRHLITYMIEDPRSISGVLDAVFAARAIERMGDHANNVCESIIYMVMGKDVRHTSLEDVERELEGDD